MSMQKVKYDQKKLNTYAFIWSQDTIIKYTLFLNKY